MTDPENKGAAEVLTYIDLKTAPIVLFDIAPAHGIMAGMVQIELAARTLNPMADGSVDVAFVTSGRLRCSHAAAIHLRNALNAALKMLEAPQPAPVVPGPSAKMN